MIVDNFELTRNNTFIKITTNRESISSIKEINYNLENLKDNEFEINLIKSYNEHYDVIELYFNMMKWLKENYPELMI